MKKIISVSLLFIVFLITGCTDKFDINQFNANKTGGNIKGDTVYVPISPAWGGFNNPQAILIGKEPFIYVSDTDNDRLVLMNLAGQILSTRSIKKPRAIAQDYKLNLIVCAEFDTVDNSGNSTTYSGVFKIDLVSAGHNLANAKITRILPRDLTRPDRRYTAVAAFYDNTFYVARKGPNNVSPSDPDNSILVFKPKKLFNAGDGDSLIGRVPFLLTESTGLISADNLNCMATFSRKNFDFIATFSSDTYFKAQWFHFFQSTLEEKYVSQFDPNFDQVPFVKVNKFGTPTGCWVDPSGFIYVADGGKDSVYKFNSFGDELHSFGGPNVFTKPSAVAFFDKTLYVVDAGANKILRFMLSTDLQ